MKRIQLTETTGRRQAPQLDLRIGGGHPRPTVPASRAQRMTPAATTLRRTTSLAARFFSWSSCYSQHPLATLPAATWRSSHVRITAR